MRETPPEVDTTFGLVNRALTFLAGYCMYVSISTDRFVGRMLDAHANILRIKGHALVGAFDSEKYTKAQAYCRTGRYANAIQIAIDQIKKKCLPQQRWTKASTWKRVLPPHSGVNENTCANIATIALK